MRKAWEDQMSDEQQDERGFDDNELADIMSEIETLESDFIDQDEQAPDPVEASEPSAEQVPVDEPVASDEEVPESPGTEQEPIEESSVSAQVHEMKPSAPVAPSDKNYSSMTFQVEGDMCFKMGFNFSGQSVTVYADGEEGLVIEMAGGVKFQVPVSDKKVA